MMNEMEFFCLDRHYDCILPANVSVAKSSYSWCQIGMQVLSPILPSLNTRFV